MLGDRSEAGQRLAGGIDGASRVADAGNLGVSRHGEIRPNHNSASTILGHAQPLRRGRRHHARAPYDRSGGQPLLPDRHTLAVALRDGGAQPDLDTELLQGLACGIPQDRGKGRKQALARLDKHDARVGRIDVAKVPAQRHARQLGNGAGHLHAGRSAANHDEGEQAASQFGRAC